MSKPHYWLVVPAAGTGQRMQASLPKQYLRIQRRFIIDITLTRLLESHAFEGCIVPLHRQDSWWPETDSAMDARIQTCIGGVSRQDSVIAALDALAGRAQPNDWVLVHDVARPCLAAEDLAKLITECSPHAVGGLLASPVTDTLKRADANQEVGETVDRHNVWRALTPQMFRFQTLRSALLTAAGAGKLSTDEASAIELTGRRPRLVEGRPDNLKITVPSDLVLAEFILKQLSG